MSEQTQQGLQKSRDQIILEAQQVQAQFIPFELGEADDDGVRPELHRAKLNEVIAKFVAAEYPIIENMPREAVLDPETGEETGDTVPTWPPEGFGIAVIPRMHRMEVVENGEKKNRLRTNGVALAVCPEIKTVMEYTVNDGHPGQKWLTAACMDALFNEIRRPMRAEDCIGADLPASVQDYITRSAKGDGLKAWREVRKPILERLKKQAPVLSEWNTEVLRSVLESKAIALVHAPKVPQTTWESVIRAAKDMAEEKGEDVRLFDSWLENRDKEIGKELDENFAFDFDAEDAEDTEDAEGPHEAAAPVA